MLPLYQHTTTSNCCFEYFKYWLQINKLKVKMFITLDYLRVLSQIRMHRRFPFTHMHTIVLDTCNHINVYCWKANLSNLNKITWSHFKGRNRRLSGHMLCKLALGHLLKTVVSVIVIELPVLMYKNRVTVGLNPLPFLFIWF